MNDFDIDRGIENTRTYKALVTIAMALDQLENVPTEVRNNKNFRSRTQLIKDILEGKV